MTNQNKKTIPKGILLTAVFILAIYFVFAAHVITPTSFSMNEDVTNLYNITINNTDALSTANITQVNITIPNTFAFLLNSNGTNAGTHTFTNTSTVLSWDNNSLIMNLTWKNFWFNATASTPGTYNLTITTTNITSSYSSNISVTINDTTNPLLNIIYPLNTSYNYNVTALNYTIIDDTSDSCWYSINNGAINSSKVNAGTNFTGVISAEGSNTWIVYCNDTAGNENSTSITFFKEDIDPIVNLYSPLNGISTISSQFEFNYNVSDANSISNCSLILNGVSSGTDTTITKDTEQSFTSIFAVGTHIYSVECSDQYNNVGSSGNRTLTVKEGTGGASSGTSSSGTTNASSGTDLFPPSNETIATPIIQIEEIIPEEEGNKFKAMIKSIWDFFQERTSTRIALYVMIILFYIFVVLKIASKSKGGLSRQKGGVFWK